MRKNTYMIFVFIFVLFVAGLAPSHSSVSAATSTVTIISNQTNVREGPGLSYKKIAQVNSGDKFSVIKESGDWIQIELSKNKKGWVANWVVKRDQTQSSSTSKVTKGSSGVATTDGLRVRSGPGTNYKVLDTLKNGTTIEVADTSDNWIKVSYSGGQGWVSKDYVKLTTDAKQQDKPPKKDSSIKQEKGYGTVTASILYVRSKGSLDGTIIGKVHQGDRFKILEETNNWIKIEYQKGAYGWVASWFLDQASDAQSVAIPSGEYIEMLHDGTNIRKNPTIQAEVVERADKGEVFETVKQVQDWFEIRLNNGDTAYVAGWVVKVKGSGQQIEKSDSEVHLKNKTIVIDPGHGGKDQGTSGYRGTSEKNITIQTAQLLGKRLAAAGANVIFTRSNDTFLSLSSRVRLSHYHAADAFISIHYDSSEDRNVRGTTSFYNNSFQKPLASALHTAVVQYTGLKDRGVRHGDYHVIRENKRNAALLELGYLSNPTEESLITTKAFQENAATGIYQGLAKYFSN
ncbi:SH3 domain-containing protein [Bacillus sp. DNRA2]|uniref:SH3 domain-containing protein n=1 Tax=Bacillus sp. DNRA2 TaxID=2723053 RepID=UPI00145DB4C2|nr:SH3 domain-containing protein [Bacillus sp. DNRA2]NMD70584.1 SH3 domain-containing protein [Bacillus sp. DNRA2]